MKSFFKEFCSSFLGVLILLITSFSAYAQTGLPLEKVEISISEPFLNMKGVPFDVPFYIEMEELSNYSSVYFRYGIKNVEDRKKRWITLPTIYNQDTLYKSKSAFVKNGKAILYCPGLHPNIPYVFEIHLERELLKDDDYRQKLKDKIADKLVEYSKKYALQRVDSTQRNLLFKELDKAIKDYTVLQSNEMLIRKSNGKEYLTNHEDYAKPYGTIENAINKIVAVNEEIKGEAALAKEVSDMLSENAKSIIISLEEIFGQNSVWGEQLKKEMNSPVNSRLNGFGEYTLNDGLELLRTLAHKPSLLGEILSGRLKIENKIIVPTDDYNIPSIHFIQLLLQKLKKGVIQYSINGKEKTAFKDNEGFNNFLTVFSGLEDSYVSLENARIDLTKGINLVQDITIELLISETITQDVIPMIEVETEKSPYFSIGTGLGGALHYPSVFHYYVMNFYFVPVNKRAPLNSFKKGNRFLKMFSLQAGFANFFSSRPENTYSVLGENTKWDVMLGVGFRITRILQVNTGTMLYRTNSRNPLLDKYTMKPSFYVSLGIDINFLKAIGNFGDFLKP